MTLSFRLAPKVECLIYCGDDYELTLVALDGEGAAVDISGAAVEFAVYAWNGKTYSGAALISKTTDNGGATLPGGTGEALITFGKVETEAMTDGAYYAVGRITTVAGKTGTVEPFLIRFVQTPLT